MSLSPASTEQRRAAADQAPRPDTLSPADRYAELFTAVQCQGVFPDSKTFVDCAPRRDPAAILAAYRAEREQPGFALKGFVHTHFTVPQVHPSHYVSVPGQPITDHIDGLWPVLTRRPQEHPPQSSLLQLPHPYVVPGGRFAEMYYWDSYFSMLGLAESGQAGLLHAMTDNFAYLIDTYGFVPNGTRSYYLSRSQPPVFALMVALCEDRGGQGAQHYLPQLRKEHAFWMEGADGLAPGSVHRRVVRLPDGTLLNRYWDDRDTPREEAYAEDVATAAAQSVRPVQQVYRDLRAAAESGWDFSSRWLCEPGLEEGAPRPQPRPPDAPDGPDDPAGRLCDICTTDILPVDLNALLYQLERTIEDLAGAAGDAATAARFAACAAARQAAVQRLMWNPQEAAFFDYDWKTQGLRTALTAAAVVPVFTGLAAPEQTAALCGTLQQRLLAPGGLGTTEWHSGQQWDRPNGWAPLQWMAVRGLWDYGHHALAIDIAHRWLDSVGGVYQREGKLVEKYALRPAAAGETKATGGHGGEYPLQDGFGWTNGVTRRLLHENPGHPAHGCEAHEKAPA